MPGTLGPMPVDLLDQSSTALAVDDVRKSFRVPEERSHTLKERALHPLRRSRHEQLHALKDISFAVRQGEFFGIVGRNGSGKSTLLKCLAGIYRADQGQIWCNGRMSTFIELGVGFNPDLAALRQRRAERDHARPLSARGARPLRARDRVRRARGVPGPEAQELLLGHARAPGLLGGDPGRRRHPADRRGARGRRRLLPAEVLRRVQPDARRRPHDRVRHARHGRGHALLPPRDAARARRDGRASATPAMSPIATWRSPSAARSATATRTSAAPAWATAPPACATCGWRTTRTNNAPWHLSRSR